MQRVLIIPKANELKPVEKWRRKSMNPTGYLTNPISKWWASQVVLVVKNPHADTGDLRDLGSILGSGRCPGVAAHSNILAQENPHGQWATVHGATKSWTQLKQLSTYASIGKWRTCNECRNRKLGRDLDWWVYSRTFFNTLMSLLRF